MAEAAALAAATAAEEERQRAKSLVKRSLDAATVVNLDGPDDLDSVLAAL